MPGPLRCHVSALEQAQPALQEDSVRWFPRSLVLRSCSIVYRQPTACQACARWRAGTTPSPARLAAPCSALTNESPVHLVPLSFMTVTASKGFCLPCAILSAGLPTTASPREVGVLVAAQSCEPLKTYKNQLGPTLHFASSAFICISQATE